ncbi:S26 family signal peptidase [Sphingomonas bacterium]|uniref:S26 family signal peptidase n=1 Tax=Sphingomonas bacterium TaxID=1895847 RepID=UPI001576FCE3|nr:S26 family signal peptidase [Sphingomonas bacterium]
MWLRAGPLGLGVGLILGSIDAPPAPRLLWNASASAPIGLYAVQPGARLRVGEMAVAVPPAAARMLAARRHYAPANVPLVKRVAAIEGASVCAIGAAILIDGRVVARRFPADPQGRALPWWHGCRRLATGETLLLNTPANSFDGRYFGPVGRQAIVGKAVPLWLR